MSAGDRNEIINIERETRGRVRGGSATSAWAQIGAMWADVQWIGGGEPQLNGAVRTTSKYRFTVLASAILELNLTPLDRIVWNGDTYNISERPKFQPAEPEVALIAESGVVQ